MRTETERRRRTLGGSGTDVGALGFGCWAIGGEWSTPDGGPLGWGVVDDDESVAAVRRALDLGVTFFDTADVYGAGHSERVLGRALAGRRDEVVVATKWGNLFDERTRTMDGADRSPEYARRALVASLRRLGTDRIDPYQLHLGDTPLAEAAELRGGPARLQRAGGRTRNAGPQRGARPDQRHPEPLGHGPPRRGPGQEPTS